MIAAFIHHPSLPDFSPLQGADDRAEKGFRMLPAVQQRNIPANDFIARVPGYLLKSGVDVFDNPCRIGDDNGLRCMFNRGSQSRLFFYGAFEPGNVNCKHSQPANFCFGVHRCHFKLNRKGYARLCFAGCFETGGRFSVKTLFD